MSFKSSVLPTFCCIFFRLLPLQMSDFWQVFIVFFILLLLQFASAKIAKDSVFAVFVTSICVVIARKLSRIPINCWTSWRVVEKCEVRLWIRLVITSLVSSSKWTNHQLYHIRVLNLNLPVSYSEVSVLRHISVVQHRKEFCCFSLLLLFPVGYSLGVNNSFILCAIYNFYSQHSFIWL